MSKESDAQSMISKCFKETKYLKCGHYHKKKLFLGKIFSFCPLCNCDGKEENPARTKLQEAVRKFENKNKEIKKNVI